MDYGLFRSLMNAARILYRANEKPINNAAEKTFEKAATVNSSPKLTSFPDEN